MTQLWTPKGDPVLDIKILAALLVNGTLPPGGTVPGIAPIFSAQTPAFNAAPAPDPTRGFIYWPAAMTGAVAVANPIYSVKGHAMLMIWQQDAVGGRALTYAGANWRSVGIAVQVTTLSTVTIDLAINQDGTIWRVMRLVTGQTV